MLLSHNQLLARPYGFVLRNPKPMPFSPLCGQLGFFDVEVQA